MNNLERFLQDDGRTMRNLLGVSRDPEAFETLQSRATATRLAELDENPDLVPMRFDRAHLAALHRHVFQDVFEWAGHMRDETVTIDDDRIGPVEHMAKPGGRSFDAASTLAAGFEQLDRMMDVTSARAMSHGAFADHAAGIFAHVNWMHPFREGNGRVQRALLQQYATSAGHELEFTYVTQARIYEASARSSRDCHRHLRDLFEEISDPDCVARLHGPYQAFSKVDGFQQLGFSHARPGHPVKGVLRGSGAGEFVVQNEATKDIVVAAIADLPKNASRGGLVDFMPQVGIGRDKNLSRPTARRSENAR